MTQKCACCFDPRNKLLSAYDIHKLIHETMRLREVEVAMVQMDGAKGQVYVKLREYQIGRMGECVQHKEAEKSADGTAGGKVRVTGTE